MKKQSSPTASGSSSLDALRGELGNSSSLDPDSISSSLLWMATVSVLRRGAAIQLSINKSKTSVIITLFDGDYPHKEFCEGIARTHHVLAAITRAYNRAGVPPEWEEELQRHAQYHGE